jgi:hypothetical protein
VNEVFVEVGILSRFRVVPDGQYALKEIILADSLAFIETVVFLLFPNSRLDKSLRHNHEVRSKAGFRSYESGSRSNIGSPCRLLEHFIAART